MTSSARIARPEQSRAQDTLRWGGMMPLSWGAGPSAADLAKALAQAQATFGQQLVNVHWRWPVVWRLALVVQGQFGAAGTLLVTYAITIGSGDGQQTMQRTVTVPTAQTDATIDQTLPTLPACDLLVRVVNVTSTDGAPLQGPGSAEIGAYAAPETEVHAPLEILACLCRIEGAGNADQRQQGEWMLPGFYPEPPQYGR